MIGTFSLGFPIKETTGATVALNVLTKPTNPRGSAADVIFFYGLWDWLGLFEQELGSLSPSSEGGGSPPVPADSLPGTTNDEVVPGDAIIMPVVPALPLTPPPAAAAAAVGGTNSPASFQTPGTSFKTAMGTSPRSANITFGLVSCPWSISVQYRLSHTLRRLLTCNTGATDAGRSGYTHLSPQNHARVAHLDVRIASMPTGCPNRFSALTCFTHL